MFCALYSRPEISDVKQQMRYFDRISVLRLVQMSRIIPLGEPTTLQIRHPDAMPQIGVGTSLPVHRVLVLDPVLKLK